MSKNKDKKNEEKPAITQAEVLQIVLERRVELAKEYVEPHNKKAREVTEKDLVRVMSDSKVMHEMCLVGRADYTTAYAIAHTQVNDEDPLAFYVTIDGQVIINPVITNYTKQLIDRMEGCMSYPAEPMKIVLRFNKVTLQYQTITYKEKDGVPVGDPTLTPEVVSKYESKEAQVIQHELTHLNGHNIYDEDANASHAIENVGLDTKL